MARGAKVGLGGSCEEEGTEEVVVEGGAKGVVLHVRRGLPLTVRVGNWPERARGSAELVPEGSPFAFRSGTRISEGRFRFLALRPGVSYTLRIAGAGGLALERPGVTAGAEELRVGLEPGLSITGRIEMPTGSGDRHISARTDRLHSEGTVRPDGTYVVSGLTSGTWEVRVTLTHQGEAWEARARVEAGGRADLAPRPWSR